MAAQTLRGSEGPGIGDVPVGLVVELEAPAPVPGLQDTRSGGNRVSSTSSGTNRLTIRAEQKSGHFIALSQLLGDIGMMGNFNVGASAVDKGLRTFFGGDHAAVPWL